MKILITGASGYIGSKVTRHLLSLHQYQIAVIIKPSANLSLLKDEIKNVKIYECQPAFETIHKAVTAFKPQAAIHFASRFINEHQPEHIRSLIENNILFGNYLLESLTANHCLRFINTGTSWQHFNNDDYNPANLYAATKQAFDDIIKYYVEAKQLKCITIKLFDTYGEDDTRPKIFSLIKKTAATGDFLEITKGEQELDIVHVNDVVKAYSICLNELFNDDSFSWKQYGLGTGHPRKLKEWISEYEKRNEKKINILYTKPYKAREVMETWKNFEKIPGLQINQPIFP